LRLPGLRRLARFKYARLLFQLPLLLLAVMVIVDGLTGRQIAPRNVATTTVWLHYRGLVVVALALFGNAELRVARSRAGVTAASAAHAGLWDDPVLAMDVTRIVSGMANPWMFMTSISFTLPVSGRLKTEIALADAGHAVELHRIAEREW
ncbi:MAG: hypothetical protein KJZ68_05085, partial [Phycisphaerales bacterium]|nr:hypothetical protein [Phycisphaerales bacterium]